jgi:acyl carrier protein
MQDSEIYTQLTSIFHDVFDDESIILTPSMTADDVDEWDSLTHIRLVLSVEKKFRIKFTAAEVGGMKNVGEFVGLVKAKI